jgi:hypothetical protein
MPEAWGRKYDRPSRALSIGHTLVAGAVARVQGVVATLTGLTGISRAGGGVPYTTLYHIHCLDNWIHVVSLWHCE